MPDAASPKHLASPRALLSRHRGALPWLALGAGLTAFGAWLRVPGWNPPSLFSADQWVGIVATRMGWSDYLSLRPPVPVGFALALALLARVLRDPEWSLQLLPVACSVAVIPLAGWLALRLTGRPALAILASAALVADPRLSTFALRAKPYAVGCLLAVVLALLATWAAGSDDGRRRVALAAAAVVAAAFSFPALLVGGALVAALALEDLGARERRGWAVAATVTFGAGALAHLALLLAGGTRDSLVEYWDSYFLPLSSLGEAGAFLAGRGVAFLTGPFPGSFEWAALLVVPGLAVLLGSRRTRFAGVAALLLGAVVLTASALRRYPLGGARTDLYAHGLLLTLACVGLAPLVRPRASHWSSLAVTVVAALCVLAARPGRYPPREDARLVRETHATLRPGDALVLYPAAGLAAGYYWPGEVRLRRDPRGCGFNAEIPAPGALTLETGEPGRRASTIVAGLDPVLERAPARLVYLATNVSGRADELVEEAILEAGYEVESLDRGPVAALTVFRLLEPERSAPPTP